MALIFLRRAVRVLFHSFGLELSRYDLGEDKWLAQKSLLEGGPISPIILDVGANIGQTVEAYKALFPTAEIHSFEPFPASYHMLQQLASRYDKIHTYPLAIADKAGESRLYVNAIYHATNSLLPRPSSGRRYYPEGAELNESITVIKETLDAFFERSGLSHIDILKMDIQGGELAALYGAKKLLADQTIGLIITEVMFIPHYEGGAMFHEINQFLLDNGYSLFGIYDIHYAENGQIRFADAIYVNRNLRAKLTQHKPPQNGVSCA